MYENETDKDAFHEKLEESFNNTHADDEEQTDSDLKKAITKHNPDNNTEEDGDHDEAVVDDTHTDVDFDGGGGSSGDRDDPNPLHDMNKVESSILPLCQYISDNHHKELQRYYNGHADAMKISLETLEGWNETMHSDIVSHPEIVLDQFLQPAIAHYSDAVEWVKDNDEYTLQSGTGDFDSEPSEVDVAIIEPTDRVKVGIGSAERSEYVDELVAVEGKCMHITDPLKIITRPTYECKKEGCLNPVVLANSTDLEHAKPNECEVCGEDYGFRLNFEQSETRKWQQMTIQEPPDNAADRRRPRTITVQLFGDRLVDKDQVKPPDNVSLVGMLERDHDGESRWFDTDMRVDSAICGSLETDSSAGDVQFTDEQIEMFETMSERDDLRDLLTQAIDPGIVGHTMEKMGLTALLFGGCGVTVAGKERRGFLHCLLIGDPATAKSDLMEGAAELSPRGQFAAGPRSSAPGIVGASSTEKIADQEVDVIEPGKLVLADNGVMAIDELDKTSEDVTKALHSPMESGRVDMSLIGKGSLSARTSVIATANPKYGYFDDYQDIDEQIEIKDALRSRFDLKFLFTDDVDEENDRKITRSILSMYLDDQDEDIDDEDEDVEYINYFHRDEDVVKHIDRDVMTQYIQYARQTVSPTGGEEIKQQLEDVFMQKRLSNKDTDAEGQVPISLRQARTLLLLSQAIARSRLSDTIEKQDVCLAAELFNHGYTWANTDSEGNLDAGLNNTQAEKYETLENVLEKLNSDEFGGATHESVVKSLQNNLRMDEERAEQFLNNRCEDGTIYKDDSGGEIIYRLI
jgi:replicative DNA helicase Mcm